MIAVASAVTPDALLRTRWPIPAVMPGGFVLNNQCDYSPGLVLSYNQNLHFDFLFACLTLTLATVGSKAVSSRF